MTFLRDIAEIRAGYPFRGSVPAVQDGNCAVVQPKNLSAPAITDGTPLARFNAERLKPAHLLKNNDVLLSSRGEFKASLFMSKHQTVASSSIFVVSVADRRFLPEYIVMYLNSKQGQAQMNSRQGTATVKAIVRSQIERLSVPLLPLKTQVALSQAFFLLKKERELSERLLNRKELMIEYALTKITGE